MDKSKIPSIKKVVSNFVKDESGIVSKDSLLKTGAVLGTSIFLANPANADHIAGHDNNLDVEEVTVDQGEEILRAKHSHNIEVITH